MVIDYSVLSPLAYFVATVVGGVLYIQRLNTRIAVLEHGHEAINEDLREIKQDVKELLRAVTS
jgi:uncharacterized protein (DUF2164 family)